MSQQYINACNRILEEGVWVYNARTESRCLTIINLDMEYDCSEWQIHLLTTKKAYWKKAVAEILGYLKGYRNAADFRLLGTDTWDANANADSWQNSHACKGVDDMGRVYGVQGRNYRYVTRHGGISELDQLQVVYDNLRKGIDTRGEIVTYWNPGELDQGCLRPCMYEYVFSLLEDTLYLTVHQRSDDIPLGHGFNQIQASFLLLLMAHITGNKPGKVFHKIVNAHVYENQIEYLKPQLSRKPLQLPSLWISPKIKTLKDVTDWVTVAEFDVLEYEHHSAIQFPFTTGV